MIILGDAERTVNRKQPSFTSKLIERLGMEEKHTGNQFSLQQPQ